MIPEGYHPDLSGFTLENFRERIKNTRMLPSQQILRENIEERFASLAQHGIENLEQLQTALRTSTAVSSFSDQTGLPADYLKVLRREVNSFHPKPVNLEDFPGVSADAVQRLQKYGIKNSAQLFPRVLTPASRRALSEQTGVDIEVVEDLTRLTDVVRTKWVGPKFARLLIASGYDSVEKIASADHQEMYRTLTATNDEKKIYQGIPGPDDLGAWIKTVQDVPRMIQHEEA
jgi:hypothetical protein